MGKSLSFRCAAVLRRFFRLQPTNLRCDSRVGDQTVTLRTEFVQAAAKVRVELNLLWPLLLPRFLPPALVLQVVASDGQRIIDTVLWPRHRSWRKTWVSLDIPDAAIQTNKTLHIRVLRQRDGQTVVNIPVTGLDLSQVAQELRVRAFELFAVQNGRRIPCDHLHDAVEQVELGVHLKLENPEHCDFLRQTAAEVSLQLSCASGRSRPEMNWGKRMELNAGTFKWGQSLGSARALFNGTFGDYALTLRLGENVVASKPLLAKPFSQCQAAAKNEVRQHARLQEAACTAINHRGVAIPLTIVAEDFRKIDTSLVFDAPDPDPLIPVVELPLRFVVRRGKTEVLVRQQHVSLKAGLNRLELTIPLSGDVFKSGPGRYGLEMRLEDRLVKRIDFLHKTRAQLKKEKAEAIWRSLTVNDRHLFVGREGRVVETDHIFERSHYPDV